MISPISLIASRLVLISTVFVRKRVPVTRSQSQYLKNHMRRMAKLLLIAFFILVVVAQAYSCSWATGYFHQVTRLRGTVVGAKIGPLQYVRWLRQSFVKSGAKLTVYEYHWPIRSRSDMPVIKAIEADSRGSFDFGTLPSGHYTLIVDDHRWGHSDWFDFETAKLPKETSSVTIDISPHFPDCKGGHEFLTKSYYLVDKSAISLTDAYDFSDAGLVKSGLGGEHTDSNQRLMYTWAWASPQKWRAPEALAASEFHLRTLSLSSLHWIMNQ